MIGEIFKAVLITSLAGSVFAGIITLFRPITKKIFGYSWHYYIWLCVLFVMLMPVRFNIKPTPTPSIAPQAVQTEQTTVGEQSETAENIVRADTAQKPQILQKAFAVWSYNRMNILAYLWLIGAIALILLNVARYIRLNTKICKNSEVISLPETEEYTDRKITVRVWENVASPFMTGVLRATLILPKTELSSEQLHNILRHEMTHFKRCDILYKWFAEFVKCVHWFNPIAWYVSKQIAVECEISCDMSVAKNMSDSEKMSYINTILSLLPTGKSKQIPLTTQMASSKKILKRRFIMIKNKKTTSRFMSVISAVIAVAMLSTTVFASGVLSDLTADDYTVEITINGEKIELANKPFIENGEVYLPLRETLTNIGTLKHSGSHINWDNGKIEVHLADVVTETMGIADVEFAFEIGKPDFIIDPNGTPNIFFRSIKTSPILRDNLTYVPYSLMAPMMEFNTTDKVNNVSYAIYDKSGNMVASTEKYSAKFLSNPNNSANGFLDMWELGEYESMKNYCSDDFIKNNFRFTDDEDTSLLANVCGIQTIDYITLGIVENYENQTSVKIPVQANITRPPHSSLGSGNINFNIILNKQNNGKWLVCGIDIN